MLNTNAKQVIAVVNRDAQLINRIKECNIPDTEIMVFDNGLQLCSQWKKHNLPVSLIISHGEVTGASGFALLRTIEENNFPKVPFVIWAIHLNYNLVNVAFKEGIADVFTVLPDAETLKTRLEFLMSNWKELSKTSESRVLPKQKISLIKRSFDVVFAGAVLLALSPLFLLLIILIKLESKGPVFYYSLRVGRGYKLFRFYKFRSMYVNADQRLKDLKHLNQYNNTEAELKPAMAGNTALCADCLRNGTQCRYPFYADKMQWCESQYISYKKHNGDAAFVKIKDDPRITRIGNFMRNTSIDELPQLWNVLIGDMSIVGNRPLPLYEAEKLTTDKYALRFLAPAGITGLWQVEKRGKGEMSEEERLMLDNVYAQNHNFLNDIKLILKTVPALFQKENV